MKEMTRDDLVVWLKRRMGLRHADAEDAASEAYLVALEHGRVDDGAYVRGCARNAARQLLQWNNRDESKVLRWWVPINMPTERHSEHMSDDAYGSGGSMVLTDATDHIVPMYKNNLTECGHDPSDIVWQQNGTKKGRARRCRGCDRERKRKVAA